MPHQNMLLWHNDYFELKALEKQQIQKGLYDFSFLPKSRHNISFWKLPTLTQEKNSILITESWALTTK